MTTDLLSLLSVTLSLVQLMLVTHNSDPTWLQTGLQAENQLAGLHVEEANVSVGEGCDHVSRFTAHQVD